MASSLNIFTVQFIQSIESEINEFILNNDISVSFDILPIIYKIIASVKGNPKFVQVLENTTVAQDKILSILKKYVVDENTNTTNAVKADATSVADTSGLADATSLADTSGLADSTEYVEPKLMPKLSKTLMLDSHKRTPSIGDVYFKFKDAITVSNFNIDFVSFTTRSKINEPYILVFIKQFKTTHFSDLEGGLGCYATLFLDTVVNHNDFITYRYRNSDMNNVNPNTITIDALNYMFTFPSTDIHKIKAYTGTTIEVYNTDNIYIDDKMRLLSEGNSLPPCEIVVVDVDKEQNVLSYIACSPDTCADEGTYTTMENINSRIVITMKYL